jgi:hypothetical protein
MGELKGPHAYHYAVVNIPLEQARVTRLRFAPRFTSKGLRFSASSLPLDRAKLMRQEMSDFGQSA